FNVPQILTWDGVSQTSAWALANFAEDITSNQKRTFLSPQGVTLLPSATSGAINITFSANVLTAGAAGSRLEYCGAQMVIETVTSSSTGTAQVAQTLPQGQILALTSTSENGYFAVGQEVAGETSGAVGIVTAIGSGNITVQIIPSNTGDAVYFDS